jgi:hypothetical protein
VSAGARGAVLTGLALMLSCSGGPPPCTQCGARCVSLETDSDNCGTCGNSCGAGSVCLGGACMLTCPQGYFECQDGCANLQSDPLHCGTCTTMCDPQSACTGGVCARLCVDPQQVCDQLCVDTSTDRANCGSCGMRCAPGSVCSGGLCVASCAVGLSTCPGDGGFFCVDLDADENNCGQCGHACTGTQRCAAGACRAVVRTPASCAELDGGPGPFFTQLYFGGALGRPFTALCGADAGTYLALPHTGSGANFSRLAGAPDAVSRYSAVRFTAAPDGGALLLTDDSAFALSTGSPLDYGFAGDCAGALSQTGTANVDLRGTAFAVDGTFALSGTMPAGSTTVSASRQVVDLTGGGACGQNEVLNAALAVRYCAALSTDGGLCP